MVHDLNGSFRSLYLVSVENERTSFAMCVSTLKSTRLVISFEYTSDKKVTYVYVAFV